MTISCNDNRSRSVIIELRGDNEGSYSVARRRTQVALR
jgi:hypothetical protein